jgi:hypothetical protein
VYAGVGEFAQRWANCLHSFAQQHMWQMWSPPARIIDTGLSELIALGPPRRT